MTLFFQQFVNGIALGSVYSLVALGLTLVYGVLKVPNFAHGALYMAGAYVSYVMMTSFAAPYIVAMAFSVAKSSNWRSASGNTFPTAATNSSRNSR